MPKLAVGEPASIVTVWVQTTSAPANQKRHPTRLLALLAAVAMLALLLPVLGVPPGVGFDSAPCPADAQSRYSGLMRLYALAPDDALHFHSDAVEEVSTVDAVKAAATAGPPTAVMFYAPWCPHCQNTMPVYDRVARNVTGVKFLTIDASTIADVRGPFGITAYPTIKFFAGGESAMATHATYDWHGAIEDDLRTFMLAQRQKVAAAQAAVTSSKLATGLLATQSAAAQQAQDEQPYSERDCDCHWIDESVTACDGGDDGTICWRACCHATVVVTNPKAPLLKRRDSGVGAAPGSAVPAAGAQAGSQAGAQAGAQGTPFGFTPSSPSR